MPDSTTGSDSATESEELPTRIKFTSYSDKDCTTQLDTITAFVNPESFQINKTASYRDSGEMAANKKTTVYESQSENLSFQNLIVDGTGMIAFAQETGSTNVEGYLKKLKGIVLSYNGTNHDVTYVKVEWGTMLIFKGVCTSFKIKYTLFSRSGAALRASVDMDFQETASIKTKAAEAKKESPDMTHIRTVQAGDTLPLMTYRIYGDSSYYLEVARINKLNHINAIKPGDQIYFPPLKK